MAEVSKLLYIVVVDDDEDRREDDKDPFRYTRSVLQSTLQLMGCKARHAFKISKSVFELMRKKYYWDISVSFDKIISARDDLKVPPLEENTGSTNACLCKADENNFLVPKNVVRSKSKRFELYKRCTTVVVGRKTFLDVICEALAEYKYMGPNQRTDLVLACRIRERKESITVLLCGTSGCGKSTLSALLGNRLGITTVISTDSIRHMMRSFVDEKENPLLWASTYHAGEYLDPVAVAEAKIKSKAKKLGSVSPPSVTKVEVDASDVSTIGKTPTEGNSSVVGLLSSKQMAIQGFKAQSEMVIDSLDRLITVWEERKESVVVEGVHLSLNFVMGLMKKHPSIIPFMIYIAGEEKHLERFAVRAKYMTLDPAKNKYAKYIRNIRTIQEYLCNRADKHLVPKINNTNVDRSVAAIHATVFSCLRKRATGEKLYDPMMNTVAVVDEEYRNQCAANSLSSKGMFQLIQQKGSSRHLMALLNPDGSVTKARLVDTTDGDGNPSLGHSIENDIGKPMYRPLNIGKAKPFNLQFGHFGISAWPSDTGGTSHAGSIDESRGELTDNGSKYCSSCCSSPRVSEGPAKELKEEESVHGSDEDVDDPIEVDSDEDLSDDGQRQIQEELEGSVDEESTKSDEEYDDLAMKDVEDNGYWSDDEEFNGNVVPLLMDQRSNGIEGIYGEEYRQNSDNILRTKIEMPSPPLRFYSFLVREKNERTVSSSNAKTRKRSQSSIPAFGKHRLLIDGDTRSRVQLR